MLASKCLALKNLDIGDCDLDGSGIVPLSKGLDHNDSLGVLDLRMNSIGADGAAAIAEVTHLNSSLRKIYLPHDSGTGVESIAQSLTNYTSTLEALVIELLTSAGLNAISSYLPDMNGLKRLIIHVARGSTPQCTDSFLEALERNNELTYVGLGFVDGEEYRTFRQETLPKVNHIQI